MGYLVSCAIMEGLQDTGVLHQLPTSLPWRAYRLPNTDFFLVEWLHRPNPNNPPPNLIKFPVLPEFARRPSGVSFPDLFGTDASGIDELYANLLRQKRASTFPKVAAHLALRLSALGACKTLCLMSDDDGWDFGCLADNGIIDKVQFDAGEGEIINIDAAGYLNIERLPQGPGVIHYVAEKWARSWDDRLAKLFGFDGDPSALGLVEIDRTPQLPAARMNAGGGDSAKPS